MPTEFGCLLKAFRLGFHASPFHKEVYVSIRESTKSDCFTIEACPLMLIGIAPRSTQRLRYYLWWEHESGFEMVQRVLPKTITGYVRYEINLDSSIDDLPPQ